MTAIRLLLLILLALGFVGEADAQGKPKKPAAPVSRTPQEIEALIDQAGKQPPAWWKSVKLNFPKTLDLTFPMPAPQPWNNQKNVGQYVWDVVNPNPGRWQEGVRFLHHVLDINKAVPGTVQRVSSMLGHAYHNLLEDWPRAVFWLRKAGHEQQLSDQTLVIAHCYWKLGNRDMAVDILKKFAADDTRHAAVIRLWAEAGDMDKALEMAKARLLRDADVGNLAAGDVCRRAGRYTEAVDYYKAAVAAPSGSRDLKQNVARAQASLQAITLFEALELKKVRPGKYKDRSQGYEDQIDVEVTVGAGKIADVQVTQHHEKQFHTSITDTCAQILSKQAVTGIDCTSGATITSEAIINATAKALAQGMGLKK